MKCPSCGSNQRAQYDRCQACNAPMFEDDGYEPQPPVQSPVRMRRGAPSAPVSYANDADYDDEDAPVEAYRPARRSSRMKKKSKLAPLFSILGIATVVLAAGGLAVFFVMKSPDDRRLQERGEHELANAQYAFAVQTLTKAAEQRPKDAKILLELARAYVGIDQVDKAWDCISKAQSLGSGVIAEPTLASDLANYYRRRGRYQKAVELLQPLAKAGVVGKKAELADLDAAWGDELLSEGKVDAALRCWEEVRDMHEGSRFSESEARLSTIYQKLANNLSSKKDDEAALAYLTKLNNIAQSPRNYEMASDIYEREGKLDLAIEQLRKASNLAGKNPNISQKLGTLLSRRGKELLDDGNTDAGYGYLQQAKDLNPQQNELPKATLRSVAITYDASHAPRIAGEMWNPSNGPISALVLKVELWDNNESKSLWEKEQRVVDAFTPPLNGHESRSFDLSAPMSVKSDGSTELRTYIDGELYKAYLLGKKDVHEESGSAKGRSKTARASAPAKTESAGQRYSPPAATESAQQPAPQTAPHSTPAPSRGSAEEKTMKDLEN